MIVVDASVFVSALWPPDVHHQASRQWLRAIEDAGEALIAPVIVLPEVAGAIARRTHDDTLGERARLFVMETPNFAVIEITEALAQRAAELATKRFIRGADAIYVAVADLYAPQLVTWDDEIIERSPPHIQAFSPDLND